MDAADIEQAGRRGGARTTSPLRSSAGYMEMCDFRAVVLPLFASTKAVSTTCVGITSGSGDDGSEVAAKSVGDPRGGGDTVRPGVPAGAALSSGWPAAAAEAPSVEYIAAELVRQARGHGCGRPVNTCRHTGNAVSQEVKKGRKPRA